MSTFHLKSLDNKSLLRFGKIGPDTVDQCTDSSVPFSMGNVYAACSKNCEIISYIKYKHLSELQKVSSRFEIGFFHSFTMT